MRLILILIAVSLAIPGLSQTAINGLVKDAETGKPIAGASIFLSNTSIGTVAGADGSFKLYIPIGKYDVVFSAVGYQSKTILSTQTDSFSVVNLKVKVNELEGVVVTSYDKDGWKNWGKLFLDFFIGTNDFSDQCKLENPSVLRFYYNKTTGKLNVLAKDVLIITNNALGYKLKYQLEDFEYDGRAKIIRFQGYPFFEQMTGSKRKFKKWKQNRKDVYEGSVMHFMRALYQNKLQEEGFEAHRLIKKRNTEKDRVKALYRTGRSKDSTNYYSSILSQPDEYDMLFVPKLTGDSIAYAVDATTAGCSFPNYLDVTYTRKQTSARYQQLYPKASRLMVSQLLLVDIEHLEIQFNGNYAPVQGLLTLGFWSWSEKISTMLPFEYEIE